MKIFLCHSYREVIEQMVKTNSSVKGYKSKLAKAAGCQSSYISQILSCNADLSLEQAFNLCEFWQFDDARTEFFLALLQKERAGSVGLRNHYCAQIAEYRNSMDVSRPPSPKTLSDDHAAIYYSSWHYAAIHLLVLLEPAPTILQIAGRLGLSQEIIVEALKSLEEAGIVRKKEDFWIEGISPSFLPRSSPMAQINHISWRQRALHNIQTKDSEALHLLLLASIKRSEIPKLKIKLAECIHDFRQTCIEDSNSDDGAAVVIDFFRI